MKAAYFYLNTAVILGLLSFSLDCSPLLLENTFTTSIKETQKAFTIEVAVNLINGTMDEDKRPRCEIPDPSKFSTIGKFGKNHLTYRMGVYTTDLLREDVDQIIEEAFATWAGVSPLSFTKTNSAADIEITFTSGDHGDGSEFDGPDGVLAHAFGPGEGLGGDIHFDNDERWTKSSQDYNLFLVALHEIGHSLGLGHSTVEDALMFPFYRYVETEGYTLPQDDVKGIQFLYGVPITLPSTTQPKSSTQVPTVSSTQVPTESSTQMPTESSTQMTTEPSTENPSTCDPNLFADATLKIGNRVYLFKDGLVRKSNSRKIRQVNEVWPGGPSNVEAAVTFRKRTEGRTTFLFEGSQFWEFKGKVSDAGNPKSISSLGLPSSVRKIDAALRINRNTIFLFVGSQLWRYKVKRGTVISSPILIEQRFEGINSVDAAIKLRKRNFLINGLKAFVYNRRGDLLTAFHLRGWLNCK